jgi:hypothetical protein
MWWYIMEGLKYKNRKCEGTYFGGYWDYVWIVGFICIITVFEVKNDKIIEKF